MESSYRSKGKASTPSRHVLASLVDIVAVQNSADRMAFTMKTANSREIWRSGRRAGVSLLITIFGVGWVPQPCRAELIYFRKGGEGQLPASIEGNQVVLAMPDGIIKLARDEVRKIVPGFWPRTEWDAQRKMAGRASFEARLATAYWAIDNGLTTEVAVELRELHSLDPQHQPTARMAAILARLDQPCAEADFGRFQNALGIGMKVARGPHVILVHQHSEAEAEERVALLERVISGFYLVFAGQGLELMVPRHAASLCLVCRPERLPGLSPLGGGGRVCHDAGVLPPDVEVGGHLRRPQC